MASLTRANADAQPANRHAILLGDGHRIKDTSAKIVTNTDAHALDASCLADPAHGVMFLRRCA